jgi:hypothetical protein
LAGDARRIRRSGHPSAWQYLRLRRSICATDKVGSGTGLLSDGLNCYRVASTDVAAAASRLKAWRPT